MLSDYRRLPVPEGWTDTTIAKLAEVRGGSTPSTTEGAYWKGDIPWATPTDVTGLSNRYIDRTETTLTEAGLRNSGASLLPAGSLLMTSRATIGACAINQRPMATNQGFASLVCRNGLNVEFLYYLISARTTELSRLASGSTFVELPKSELRKLRVLCPPEDEQTTIAATLNAVDDAIEQTRGVIAQTRQLKTALLQDLLTHGLPGRHSEFKVVRGLGTIPVSWDVVRLDKMAKVDRGKFTHRPRNDPKFYGGDIPFVQTGDVGAAGDYLSSHSQTLNELGLSISRMFPAGTILFVIAGSVGEPTIASYDVAFPDSVVGITPKDGVDPLFLLRVLQHAQERIIRTATESAQANISLELLRPLPMPLPGREERDAIATVLRSVEERVEKETSKLDQLTQAKTALSQGLLTGRVRARQLTGA
jgi:type I restriction enzyme S subunit